MVPKSNPRAREEREPRSATHERSLVDALCEGEFDDLPKCSTCDDRGPGVRCEPSCVRDRLRAVANHRHFPTVDAQWKAAAVILEESRDG